MTPGKRRFSAGRVGLFVGGLGVAGAALIGIPRLVDDTGVPQGSALDNPGGGAILQPVPPDTPLAVGTVGIKNTSRDPIKLVKARLLRLDPDVTFLGFSVLPTGPNAYGMNPPLTWLEWPLKGAVALPDYPAIPPAPDDHEQATLMFGLSVKPQRAGKAVGIELTYRQQGSLRMQVFEDQVYVCWVPTSKDGDCPGVDGSKYDDVFGDFEDEVNGPRPRSG